MKMEEWATKKRSYVAVAGAYGVLVLLLTYPLIINLSTHVPGELIREDFWVHLWTFDWIRDALFSGMSPLYTLYHIISLG